MINWQGQHVDRNGIDCGNAGAEYAFDHHWSLEAEYLYVDAGSVSVFFRGSLPPEHDQVQTALQGIINARKTLIAKDKRRVRPMNAIDLKNRTAIVTGGARGIGFAIAKRMLASGAAVALWDIDAAALEQAAVVLKGAGRVQGQVVDVTDEAAVAGAVAALKRDLGKIDILVNNAGITGGNAPLWELAPEVWRRVIEINLIAPYLICRAVVPHMVAARYGRIVNIASIAGKEGNPNASHYSASKAGLIALAKSLAKELAATGVLVNCVTPAAARTELFAQMSKEHIDYMLSKIPMNRFVEVDEIAALAAWLASEDCSFSTGAVFDISGGRAVY
jgi:2-dehydro-3-deoxy-L-rhamnonate dehydrogenase (NAD+)